MINLSLSDVRIFLCATPIHMHCGFDTLMGLAQTVFDQDPLSGHLFLFFNRERNRVKILFWDQDGFCIWYKLLATSKASSWTMSNCRRSSVVLT
jgi:transposase